MKFMKYVHIGANLKKVPKLKYPATHSGNNKQNVSLALAVFDEATSAGCY